MSVTATVVLSDACVPALQWGRDELHVMMPLSGSGSRSASELTALTSSAGPPTLVGAQNMVRLRLGTDTSGLSKAGLLQVTVEKLKLHK